VSRLSHRAIPDDAAFAFMRNDRAAAASMSTFSFFAFAREGKRRNEK